MQRSNRKKTSLSFLLRIFPIFIFIFACCSFLLAQEESTQNAIYQNVGHFCKNKSTLLEEKCYEAFMAKAMIDALINQERSPSEIYSKIADHYGASHVLNEELRREAELDLAKPKPRLEVEGTYFRFDKFSRSKGDIRDYYIPGNKGNPPYLIPPKLQQRIQHRISISNKGEGPLVIKRMATSCACMTVSLVTQKTQSEFIGPEGTSSAWSQELLAQETGHIDMTLDLLHPDVRPGPFREDIFILSNDPLRPQLKITIETEIE
ncbi:MAG: hypothetical protein ABIJ41_07135 [Candidatus Omnitrophota bacterium]